MRRHSAAEKMRIGPRKPSRAKASTWAVVVTTSLSRGGYGRESTAQRRACGSATVPAVVLRGAGESVHRPEAAPRGPGLGGARAYPLDVANVGRVDQHDRESGAHHLLVGHATIAEEGVR